MNKTIKRLHMLDDALMYNGLGAYVEDLNKAIKALALLPEIIAHIESLVDLNCGTCVRDLLPERCGDCNGLKSKELIQKAKDVIE